MSNDDKKGPIPEHILVAVAVEVTDGPHHPSCPLHQGSSRPSMVNSQAYRDNFTTIFGKKHTIGDA